MIPYSGHYNLQAMSRNIKVNLMQLGRGGMQSEKVLTNVLMKRLEVKQSEIVLKNVAMKRGGNEILDSKGNMAKQQEWIELK